MQLLLAGLLLSCSSLAVADALAPQFRRYGPADGLPAVEAFDLAQDTNGYLWVATRDGLARFDGRRFQVLRHAPSDPGSLPCNDVQTVLATRNGRIVVGCEGAGLAWLDGSDDTTFTHLAPNPSGGGLRGGDVFALAETASGTLYIGTYAHGLARLRTAETEPVALDRLLELDPALRSATVLDLAVDGAGVLWVGTLDAVWRIDHADSDRPGPARKVLELPLVNTVTVTADGTLWVGGHRALYRRPPGGDVLIPVALPNEAGLVLSVADAEDGAVWIAARGGLLRLRRDGRGDWLKPRAVVPGALPDPEILELLRDREGGLWLTTGARGLAYLRPDWMQFQAFRHDPLDPESPPPGRRGALAQCPDGSLWMLVRSGELARMSPAGEVRRWFSKTIQSLRPQRLFAGLSCAADGTLWLADRTGLMHFDPVRDRLTNALPPGSDWAGGVPEAIARSGDGRLWIGALTAGLNVFTPGLGNVVWRPGEHGLENDDFEQISADPEGRIWIADAAGLRYFDAARDAFVRFPWVSAERVHAFAFLAADRLAVHQLGRLQMFVRGPHGWSEQWRIGEREGLPIAEASTLIADHDGLLWLTNPRGLWTITADGNRVRAIGSADGLPEVQFEVTPSAHRQGDALIFLISDGLLRIDPRPMPKPIDPAAPLHWQRLSHLRGETAVERLIKPGASLRFEPKDHELIFGARLLSFLDPNANRYQFFVEGFDADWVDAGATGERVISKLPPGRYRISVRAQDALGRSARSPLPITLEVAPPWWSSHFAYLGYVALAGLVFAGLWRAKRKRLDARHALALAEERRRHAELASVAKSEFLATVGHEIRTPMTGVLGMAELLAATPLNDQQRHYVETVLHAGRHLIHLVNDLLDLSRAEAGKLALVPKPTVLAELLREVHEDFVPLAERKGLACTLDLAGDLPAAVEVDPVRLRQIVLNLLNNALKFTARGRIALQAYRDGGRVCIAVEDTGPGMTEDECARLFQRFSQTKFGAGLGGSGLGLSIVHQLAQLMGGDVQLNSTPGIGSRFVVRLPLPEVALPDPGKETVSAPDSAVGQKFLRTVLVVEDDAATREVITTWLRGNGLQVRAADQGLFALHLADAAIDVVISDLDLPGIDGKRLLPLLRQRIGRRVPALAITARNEAEAETLACSAGFDAFLRKPFEAASLLALLNELVDRPNKAA